MKQRVLNSLIIIVMGMWATKAFANFSVPNADGVTIYYQYYNANNSHGEGYVGDKTRVCVDHINHYSGKVVIPSSITYNGITSKVVCIHSNAFNFCTDLTEVIIPNSVTEIGSYAFVGCKNLTELIIPNSVTEIGAFAFAFSGITTLTIPNSVNSIGRGSDWNNTTYKLSASNIAAGCSNLTSIKVENGNSAFDSRNDCNAIIETATNTLIATCKNTSIPSSITSIGAFALVNLGLINFTIPNSVTSIGSFAFSWCSRLTDITIPNSVTSIGDYAFSDCI